MNHATAFDLSATIEASASDEAKLDYYLEATKMVLEDIHQRDLRIEAMQEETRKVISELMTSMAVRHDR